MHLEIGPGGHRVELSWVPAEILESLGVERNNKWHFRQADGTILERWTGGVLDRKSTRLNSSHSQISYAVFCLKKKKREVARQLAGPPQDAVKALPGQPDVHHRLEVLENGYSLVIAV